MSVRSTSGSGQRISTKLGKDAYEHVCRIYFIEAIGLDLIKIGYAVDPVKRFKAMLTVSPSPLSLLGSIWGGPKREAEIHAALDAHRMHGEWFDKGAPEVMALVATADRVLWAGILQSGSPAAWRGPAGLSGETGPWRGRAPDARPLP